MTYARDPGSIEAALLESIDGLAPSEVEEATGRRPKYFYHKANPHNESRLALEDAARLDAALTKAGKRRRFGPIFDAIYRASLGDREAPRDEDLAGYCLDKGKVLGELQGLVRAALEDGRIDDAELRGIAFSAQNILQMAQAFSDDVQAMMSARKSGGPRKPAGPGLGIVQGGAAE